MAEYGRTETHQFCDTEVCMVIDVVTGKPERLFGGNAVMPFYEALEFLKRSTFGAGRYVVIKLQGVRGFKLEGV